MATVTQQLLTAEEYGELGDLDRHTELVRGEIVEMNMPYSRHGQVCFKTGMLIYFHAAKHGLGHVITNDTGVVTRRNPDTVRGADVAFYSYQQVAPGPFPRRGYLPVSPDLIFEVRSPNDRWANIVEKVGEYLSVGVRIVVVLDPDTECAHVYSPDEPPQKLAANQILTLPTVLGDFATPVSKFFE